MRLAATRMALAVGVLLGTSTSTGLAGQQSPGPSAPGPSAASCNGSRAWHSTFYGDAARTQVVGSWTCDCNGTEVFEGQLSAYPSSSARACR